MYIHYFKLYNISGGLYHDNPFTSAANTQIRHVFCFGAYPRAQRPDILNGAQWTQLSPSSESVTEFVSYLILSQRIDIQRVILAKKA